MQQQPKKVWGAPTLTSYGKIEQITAQSLPTKLFGSADGAIWQGQPVKWSS